MAFVAAAAMKCLTIEASLGHWAGLWAPRTLQAALDGKIKMRTPSSTTALAGAAAGSAVGLRGPSSIGLSDLNFVGPCCSGKMRLL